MDKKNIGELLIECGKITNVYLEEGLRVQKEWKLKLGETLIRLCKVKRADKAGRVAALEILFSNVAIANLIREGKTFQIPPIMQMGKVEGMQLLDRSIMEFLMQKIGSSEEAYKKANDKKTFERFLK